MIVFKLIIERESSKTYWFLSKLFLLLSSFRSPEFPSVPNILMRTSASVPAPLLSPVYTITLYLLAEIIHKMLEFKVYIFFEK